MAYRFVKVTSFYRNFLNDYYGRKSFIKDKSYQEQYNDLMGEKFGWSDFFKSHMESIGNEAYEIVFNATPLQQKWAEENDLHAAGSDIVFHQLKKINPEVIFFQDSISFSAEFINKVRSEIPGVKQIIGWLCSPYSDVHLKVLKEMDFICVCSQAFSKYLSGTGIKTYELNHAFEASIIHDLDTTKKITDISFFGSFIGSRDFHEERIRLFEDLLSEDLKIELHTVVPEISFMKLKSIQAAYVFTRFMKSAGMENLVNSIPLLNKAAVLKSFPVREVYSEKFRKAVKEPVFGLRMFNELAQARIGLNIHGGIAGEYAANSRMFEVTGVGSLLLTDHKKDIQRFFEPDKEVVTFSNSAECREKIRWLITNPKAITEISDAGQKRTLRSHTFKDRIHQLDEIIKKELAGK